MSAEEQRQQVMRAAALGIKAVNAMEAAENSSMAALQWIQRVSNEMSGARTLMVGAINHIDDMLAVLRPMLVDTYSIEALQAISQFEMAREKFGQYIVMLRYQTDKVDAIRTVLELGVATEHFAEGRHAFQAGLEHLQEYNNGL